MKDLVLFQRFSMSQRTILVAQAAHFLDLIMKFKTSRTMRKTKLMKTKPMHNQWWMFPFIKRTQLSKELHSLTLLSQWLLKKTTSTPTPPTTQAQVTNASKSDSSLKFEQRLPELEKKVEAMPKRAWIEKDQKWTHEMNIRVMLHSLYSDDGNPTSSNIKQALQQIVTNQFTLIVLSALRHSGNENKQARSVLMEQEVNPTKHGRMTKLYSSTSFVTDYFIADKYKDGDEDTSFQQMRMTMHEVMHELVVGECHEPNSKGSGSSWKAYMNVRVPGLFLLVLLEYPNGWMAGPYRCKDARRGQNNDFVTRSFRSKVEFKPLGKLNLRYIGPFKILAKGGTVAYRLELLKKLSRVHNTFHVSNLKKCVSDETLAIPLDEIQIDDKLHFIEEPVEIMDREVKLLKHSHVPIIKVRWNLRRGPEFT
ncbi:hypothetical protein Tco_0313150 [Tanacetum coccineum]